MHLTHYEQDTVMIIYVGLKRVTKSVLFEYILY